MIQNQISKKSVVKSGKDASYKAKDGHLIEVGPSAFLNQWFTKVVPKNYKKIEATTNEVVEAKPDAESIINQMIIDNPQISASTFLNLLKSKGIKFELPQATEADMGSGVANGAMLRGGVKTLEGGPGSGRHKSGDQKSEVVKDKTHRDKTSKLLGTAPSEKGVKDLLAKFWYGKPENYSFQQFDKDPNEMKIFSSGKEITGARVLKKGNRFRFEMFEESSKSESGLVIKSQTFFEADKPKDAVIGFTKFKVVLLQEGMGNFKDGYFYSKEAIESAIPVFEGAKIYADHPTAMDEQLRPERSVRDVLGHFENVRVELGESEQTMLVGDVVIVPDDQHKWARALMGHAVEYAKKFPDKDFVGLSINASGDASEMPIDEIVSKGIPQSAFAKIEKAKESGATSLKYVSKINAATSCDLVTEAGAGGRVLEMIESDKKKELNEGGPGSGPKSKAEKAKAKKYEKQNAAFRKQAAFNKKSNPIKAGIDKKKALGVWAESGLEEGGPGSGRKSGGGKGEQNASKTEWKRISQGTRKGVFTPPSTNLKRSTDMLAQAWKNKQNKMGITHVDQKNNKDWALTNKSPGSNDKNYDPFKKMFDKKESGLEEGGPGSGRKPGGGKGEKKKTSGKIDYLKHANDFEKSGHGHFSRSGKGGTDLHFNAKSWSSANAFKKAIGGHGDAQPDAMSGHIVVKVPNVYKHISKESNSKLVQLFTMLESERNLNMKKKMMEMEKETEKTVEAGEEMPAQDTHADEQQDIELIKAMIAKYLGDEETTDDEKSLVKEAYEACKEMGMGDDEAGEKAVHQLKLAKHLASKQEKPEGDETEVEEGDDQKDPSQLAAESEEAEKVEESEEEKKDEEEKVQESAKVIQLQGKIAKLEQEISNYKNAEKLETLLKESKLPMSVTKKFREAVVGMKSVKEIENAWKLFEAGYKSTNTSSGDMFEGVFVQPEKTVSATKAGMFDDVFKK